MVKKTDQLTVKLKLFINVLQEMFDVYAVVLFGSYAEGNENEYSDIDIAVFSANFGKNPFEEMKTLFKLRRKIDTNIEPLPFSRNDFFEHNKANLVNDILSKGKIIFKEGKTYI